MILSRFILLGILLIQGGVVVVPKAKGISISDCKNPHLKDEPECICRFPINWETELCQNRTEDIMANANFNFNFNKNSNDENDPSKIVGGENTPPDAYPWFTRLIFSYSGVSIGCGGMLVAPEYVLTAAHCVYPTNPAWSVSQAAVEIGYVCPTSQNNCDQPLQKINVVSIIPQPNFNFNTRDDDYALIKLASRANANPVAMDQGQYVDNYSSQKRDLWAVGTGNLSLNGSAASQLRHVELAFTPKNTCNNAYDGIITANMMCAQDPGQDSCQGDSGGPLYDKENDVLVGIVSWGYGCADFKYPGVYAQVSSRWDWIKSNICRSHSNPQPSFCINTTTQPSKTPSSTQTLPPTTSPTNTVTPTLSLSTSTSCSSKEFLGRTVFLPYANMCLKIEFFPEGIITMDTSDPTCSKKEHHDDQVVISAFSCSDRGNIYFKRTSTALYEGKFDFEEDSSVTNIAFVPKYVDTAQGTFDLGLIFPSCDMGPTYPCFYESMLDSAIFVPIENICFKIEFFEGGVLAGDVSDPTCSKDVKDHTASIVASKYSHGRGNKVFFDDGDGLEWSGFFEFSKDSSFELNNNNDSSSSSSSSGPQVRLLQNKIDASAKKFELGLTFPTCDPSLI